MRATAILVSIAVFAVTLNSSGYTDLSPGFKDAAHGANAAPGLENFAFLVSLRSNPI